MMFGISKSNAVLRGCQLLLGTILFTVLVFLFPTSFVYYLLFYLLKHAVGRVRTSGTRNRSLSLALQLQRR